ncbi:hypothetical protein CBR_g32572 [Chara braunii]|uniref:Glutaredoxin domain-containing protein n=1 Tax=Chara braunii TaxID=69332 RepID=A0A388LGW7_CHABU|nr:hypothetical protein CBR_g32572 [Chara braunii]|eukprot:GBG81580.1 hypothetical protein CBR_g32572 [Chara braunii]
MTAMEKVKELVESNGLVVFSKTWCSYCIRVRDLFNEIGAKGKFVQLDEEEDGEDMQFALLEWTGQRTVPNVFIGGEHVGGCDDTVRKHRREELIPMLESAGVLEPRKE